jgi:hypothetical protein
MANLHVSSDSAWVIPSVDSVNKEIVLEFSAGELVNAYYSATITASSGGETVQCFVRAHVSPLNIFKLKDDPRRSRTYGIQQNHLESGAIVILDPVDDTHIGTITVGKKPCDLAESRDGRELFVINSVDPSITVIDLVALSVKETIPLTIFQTLPQAKWSLPTRRSMKSRPGISWPIFPAPLRCKPFPPTMPVLSTTTPMGVLLKYSTS